MTECWQVLSTHFRPISLYVSAILESVWSKTNVEKNLLKTWYLMLLNQILWTLTCLKTADVSKNILTKKTTLLLSTGHPLLSQHVWWGSRVCSVLQPCTLHRALQEPFTCSYKVEGIINSWFPEEIQQHSFWIVPWAGLQAPQGHVELQHSPALDRPSGLWKQHTWGLYPKSSLCPESHSAHPFWILHHSCCWAILPLVSKGRIHQGRDLLPFPMEAKRAEMGFILHGHNRRVLNAVHWEQSFPSK